MSGPNNIDREQLRNRLDRQERWGQAFGWTVGIGLLIEYGPEIVDCFVKWHLPSWPLIGGLLVTLGVFGEIWFSRIALKTAEEISNRADSDVASANERAEEARKQAALAIARAGSVAQEMFRDKFWKP